MDDPDRASRRPPRRPLRPGPEISGPEIVLATVLTLMAMLGLAVAEGAELRLAWVDRSGGTAGFRIERRLATESAFAQVGTQAPGSATFTDSSVADGLTYCYRVKAYNQAGESGYSDEACGTPVAGFEVTVRTRGNGRGAVRRSPNSAARSAGASSIYPVGTVVTLTATPEPGSVFAGWSGGGCQGTEPCSVAGNGSITVTATFVRPGEPGADRAVLLDPGDGTLLAPGSTATFVWTALAGTTQYGFEFTGASRQFANPNGAAPDGVNGFGGAGGGFLVTGTSVTLTIPAGIPPGAYQVRVIGVAPPGLVGTFSDALTVMVGAGTATALR
jgi:hypothetical protein